MISDTGQSGMWLGLVVWCVALLAAGLFGSGLGVVATDTQALAIGHRVGATFGVRDDVVSDDGACYPASSTDRVTSQDGAAHGGWEAAPLA